MNFTFLGHSTFTIETNGYTLLFDPFISGNEKAVEKGIKVSEQKPDYIILSHGHQDHVLDVKEIAQKSGATIIAGYEVATWFQNKGLENVIPMNPGGTIELPFGSLKMFHAIHSSSLPDGSYGGVAASLLLKAEGKEFFFSGDTALHSELKLIGELNSIDTAALCIGGHFTMDYKDAALAADWLGVKDVIGVHFDTFPPIEINHEEAINHFSEKGISLNLLEIGAQKTL